MRTWSKTGWLVGLMAFTWMGCSQETNEQTGDEPGTECIGKCDRFDQQGTINDLFASAWLVFEGENDFPTLFAQAAPQYLVGSGLTFDVEVWEEGLPSAVHVNTLSFVGEAEAYLSVEPIVLPFMNEWEVLNIRISGAYEMDFLVQELQIHRNGCVSHYVHTPHVADVVCYADDMDPWAEGPAIENFFSELAFRPFGDTLLHARPSSGYGLIAGHEFSVSIQDYGNQAKSFSGVLVGDAELGVWALEGFELGFDEVDGAFTITIEGPYEMDFVRQTIYVTGDDCQNQGLCLLEGLDGDYGIDLPNDDYVDDLIRTFTLDVRTDSAGKTHISPSAFIQFDAVHPFEDGDRVAMNIMALPESGYLDTRAFVYNNRRFEADEWEFEIDFGNATGLYFEIVGEIGSYQLFQSFMVEFDQCLEIDDDVLECHGVQVFG